MRASDADRAATVGVLQNAVGHGLLTLDEGSERMATAFAARWRDELPAITADLPAPVASGPVTPVGWRTLAAGLVAQLQHELRATRAAGVRSRRFVVSAVTTVVLVVLLVVLVAHGVWDGGPGDGFHGHGFRGDGF